MPYRKSHVAVAELIRLKEAGAETGTSSLIQGLLDGLREHLTMDVAFISEFCGDRRVFRHVSKVSDALPIEVGESDPLGESYCHHVIEGRLPDLIKDAGKVPFAASLPSTDALPIGAHLCVPLTLADGSVYGTMCCFSTKPDSSLNRRNLDVLRIGARLATDLIERKRRSEAYQGALVARIAKTIKEGQFTVVYQPIFSIANGQAIGVEALTRFPDAAERPPSAWFDEADEVDLTVELELATIRRAIDGLAYLPQDIYLSVNVSPETLLSGQLLEVLRDAGENRIVVELTEHEAVEDYETLKACLDTLDGHARLAIDDVGAGHSSMRHILDLGPDFIKLDISIVRDLHKRASRSAFVKAMVEFARVANATIVAEGVETQDELDELAKLDAANAQGYHLCRPMPLLQVSQCLMRGKPGETRIAQHRYN